MTDRIIQDFIALFQGNTAAVGLEQGGCHRLEEGVTLTWEESVEDHLTGKCTPIGVYPMMLVPVNAVQPEWMVHWGCIDWDIGEEASLAHARNVELVLPELGMTGWVERSRSKGYHLWVFAQTWVPAVTMRRALLAACQVVGAPATEVNPKQTTLNPGQLGNYVRLPYPGSWGRAVEPYGARRVVIDRSGHTFPVGEFVSEAMGTRATVAQLEQLGQLYQEPKPRQRQRTEPSNLEGDSVARMSGLAWKIWTEGPTHLGRGKTLYKLACQLFEDGNHTAEEAEELLLDADDRWGKFTARGEAFYVTRMVDKIWEEEG